MCTLRLLNISLVHNASFDIFLRRIFVNNRQSICTFYVRMYVCVCGRAIACLVHICSLRWSNKWILSLRKIIWNWFMWWLLNGCSYWKRCLILAFGVSSSLYQTYATEKRKQHFKRKKHNGNQFSSFWMSCTVIEHTAYIWASQKKSQKV